ncbi:MULTISPECIES: NUDIX domain-containing protein [unclassified Streptomyces]|uniref:NUDIX domain-containing protein n=1 Tax=unclassified Streptomyces TaxID=2593676 RepID=UPI001660652C|nr:MULTISPECIES: NUDIX hydrolase [unclassified Streptomyces]MBD0708305.1 NUDIX domain-containing protein [Streptomyces sp. CBMA291]MBD0712661.1 NUDIX domain-containing protein [Streptomyces sp. CBMA370]
MTNVWLPPAEYVATLPRATAYACLYFTDTHGRPLQLRASYDTRCWQWPGGNMDPGETPWETAVRECHEETGLVHTGAPRLLGTHFVTDRGEQWPANHIGFIFDGGELTDEQIAAVVLDPDEHSEYRLLTLAEWEREMTPREYGRLAGIDRARRTGIPVYLETGEE